MNGRLLEHFSVNPITSLFMLEVLVEISQEHYDAESLNTATTDPITKDLINEALERGYEFWVRVKIVTGCHPYKEDAEVAEDMENKLLDRYDYAWNVRRNGRVRNILP